MLDLLEVQNLAREAYVFAFPQVYYYLYMYPQAVVTVGEDSFGGFNVFRNYGMGNPSQQIGVPNVDTPYSRAWVDTRAEPIVLTMPPVGPGKDGERRFYSSVWADLWGFILDYPGSILDGGAGGRYLLASPSWQGQCPAGIDRVIQGETSVLCTVTRTEAFGRLDMPNVEQIQSGYTLQRLSEYLDTPSPPDAPALDWPVPADDALTQANSFFPLVNFLLTNLTQQNPADAATYDRIARIGVGPGMTWDPGAQSDAYAAALQAGVKAARAEIEIAIELHRNATDAYTNRAGMKSYLSRAGGVMAGGLAPNVPQQAMYFQFLDEHHKAPDGSLHDYTVTFPPGQLPPVDYFWSVTSYSLPDRWLVQNPIRRYAIGSRNRLRFEQDGSLILYLQVASPGLDRVSNWLPIANGPAFEVLRLYGPSQAVLDGSWQPPRLVRVQNA